MDIKDNKVQDYGVKVENGEIIIKSKSLEDYYEIKTCDNMIFFINGEKCEKNTIYKVVEGDEILYKSEKVNGVAKGKVTVSKDKMKAFCEVEYIPDYTFELEDKPFMNHLALTVKGIPGDYPKKYDYGDIKEQLSEKGIFIGIIDENIEEVIKGKSDKPIIVAEGIEPEDDVPNVVKKKVKFVDSIDISPDSDEKIDYRQKYKFEYVKKGDIIAEVTPYYKGRDGINLFGEVVKRKITKELPVRVGVGCEIVDGNIIATDDGRPSEQNGLFSVNKLLEINKVNIDYGNVEYNGDVLINTDVEEGMKVVSGNTLTVRGNVFDSEIQGGGTIKINGKSINSTIVSGKTDFARKLYLTNLNQLIQDIKVIMEFANRIMEKSRDENLGEVLKIVSEKKCKNFQKTAFSTIVYNSKQKMVKNSQFVSIIKENLLGLGLSKIDNIQELQNILKFIENEIEFWKEDVDTPVDIVVGSCQDVKIISTGNIIINGEEIYLSEFEAAKDIIVNNTNSVLRGGTIKAGGNMKLGSVGSRAESPTKLVVPREGIITAEKVYKNTKIKIGKRNRVIETEYKKFKAYLDDELIVVEGLKM